MGWGAVERGDPRDAEAVPCGRRRALAPRGWKAGRVEAASTHWMRHTFARQSLVDGAQLEVVSKLTGHASIDTTSIYSTQELARKIGAVRLKRALGILQ